MAGDVGAFATFVDLYRSMGSYRGESALATWVWRVALNHCRRLRGTLSGYVLSDAPLPEAAP